MTIRRVVSAAACLGLLALGAYSYNEVDFGQRTAWFFTTNGEEAREARSGEERGGRENGEAHGATDAGEPAGSEQALGRSGGGRGRGMGRGRGFGRSDGGPEAGGHGNVGGHGMNLVLTDVFHYTVILAVTMMLTVVVDRLYKARKRRRRLA